MTTKDKRFKPKTAAKKTAAKKPRKTAAKAKVKKEVTTNESRGRTNVAEKTIQRRRRRGSNDFSNVKKLGVDMSALNQDKWSYRWVHDTPGRVRAFTEQNDYEIVPASELEDSKGLGTDIRRSGGEHDMILLRIPKEYHEEDQRDKLKSIRETEKQIKEGHLEGQGEGAIAHRSQMTEKTSLE